MTQADGRDNRMGAGRWSDPDRVSLFDLGAIVLERRWLILIAGFLGAVASVAPMMFDPPEYVSRASFIPKGGDNGSSSSLRSLAGQFGIAIPGMTGGSPLQSAPFLTELVTSPMILGPIVDDTVVVPEGNRGRASMIDLMEIPADAQWRREDAIKALADGVRLDLSQRSGTLTLVVRTQWPSVSTHVATRVLEQLNAFNLRVGQSDATQEVRSVDALMADQRKVLATAEERLGEFLQRNRQPVLPPDLRFERDRLEREVSLQQQVLVGLAQSKEEARLRALRDVPVLTVIEPPTAPMTPEPRGRLLRAVTGALIGGIIGAFLILVGEFLSRRRVAGDPEAERFFQLAGGLVPFRRKTTAGGRS